MNSIYYEVCLADKAANKVVVILIMYDINILKQEFSTA